MNAEAGHPDATDLMRDYSVGNPDAMDILMLGLGLGLGKVLGLGHQDVPGLKNTKVSFLASGRSRQNVADPGMWGQQLEIKPLHFTIFHHLSLE